MLLVGIARHYLVSLLNSPPKAMSPRQLREQRALMRGQLLRANGRYISQKEYATRRELLMDAYQEGTFLAKPREIGPDGQPVSQPPPNPLDPAAMDGMMGMFKKQAVMFIPQSILMGWINLFFSGFVLSKLARGESCCRILTRIIQPDYLFRSPCASNQCSREALTQLTWTLLGSRRCRGISLIFSV